MESNHATVVAYYRDPVTNELFYLTGKESAYPPQIDYPAGLMNMVAKEAYVRGRIAADPDVSKHYVPRFMGYTIQTLKPSSKRGFPKGRIKSIDGGSTQNTAVREFKEEIGYDIPDPNENLNRIGSVKMGSTKTDIYILNLNNNAVREEVREAFQRLGRMSELFDIQFESSSHIDSHRGSYNLLSLAVFDYVKGHQHNLQGGSRNKRKTKKQRRMKRSKTRRMYS